MFFFGQCDFLFLVMSFIWLSSLSCFVFSSLLFTAHGLTQIVNAFPLFPIIVAFYIGKLNNNKKCWLFLLYFSLCEQVHIPLPTLMVDVLFFIIKINFSHLMVFIVYCVPHVVCCPCSLSTILWCKTKDEEKQLNCQWSKLWQTPNMILCLILSNNLHFMGIFSILFQLHSTMLLQHQLSMSSELIMKCSGNYWYWNKEIFASQKVMLPQCEHFMHHIRNNLCFIR